MRLILSIASLFFISELAFSKSCPAFLEATQKKLITQHIHKYPLNYGKDVGVIKIETLKCTDQGPSHYLVNYHDIACYDLEKTGTEVVKCYTVQCQSNAAVSMSGNVDFELASPKSCRR